MMMKNEEGTGMKNATYGARSSSGMSFCSDLPGSGGAGYENLCFMLDGMGNGVGGELGFLEMLGQEFQIPIGYMFEEMPDREVTSLQMHQVAAAGDLGYYGKRHFEDGNAPGTPNSSSISFASNNEGAVVESEPEKEKEEEQDQEGSGKSKKKSIRVSYVNRLKAKKANLKKQKQPRFAFLTNSEVDHLEDGYRWRKYGQKAVKNSPFPRNYYRCTSASCGVKKRVERSCTEQSIVVTTYEGQHTHPSPLIPRGSISFAIFQDSPAAAAIPTLMQMNLHSLCEQQQPSSYFASPPNFTSFTHSPSDALSHRDHGLLEDLIPSLIPKEECSYSIL